MSYQAILDNLTPEEREAADLRASIAGRRLDRGPRVLFLIGVPASGKSTWREKYLTAETDRDTVVISSDDMILAHGAAKGLDYTAAHREVDMKAIDKELGAKVRVAAVRGQDIILDRTNLRIKPRNRFLSNIPKRYTRVAVVFWADCATLRARLDHRAKTEGKYIPFKVVQDMLEGYQAPTHQEFDLIEVYPK